MRVSFFLVLLLALPLVSAVGFANLPGEREFVFTPGGHIEVPVIVTNAERIRAGVSSPAPGDPATQGTAQDDYILAYARLEDPAPDSGPREVRVVFDFPQQMRPGTYYVDVHSSEIVTLSGASIAGVASAKFRLTVRVLSPEKILEVTALEAPPIAEGLDANATVRFVSRTTQRMDGVRAAFSLRSGDEILSEAQAGPVPLESAATGALTAVLGTAPLAGGEYDVHVEVIYDGLAAQAGPVILKIGSLHVDVPEHTRNLTRNATNKFQFNVTNQWNQQLRDVYAIVRAGGQEKKTASLNVPPFGKQGYEIYFDREPTFPLGPLPVNVTVAFQDYDPSLGRYVAKEESFLLTAHVDPAPEEQSLNVQVVLLYGLAGLIVVLLIIVILLMRRRKPEQPPGQPNA